MKLFVKSGAPESKRELPQSSTMMTNKALNLSPCAHGGPAATKGPRSATSRAEGGPKNLILSFAVPARVQTVSYRTCKRQLSQAMQKSHRFDDGILLNTLEKGVWYPVVHISESAAIKTVPAQLQNPNVLGRDYILQQGIYQQIRTIDAKLWDESDDARSGYNNSVDKLNTTKTKSLNSSSQSLYLIVGFKGLGWSVQDVLEDSWKEWTGARHLYINIPDCFGLRRITLLRRVTCTDPVAVFSYVLLVEFRGAISQHNQLMVLDYVQRYRAERGQGFLSLYQEAGVAASSDSVTGYSSTVSSDFSSEDFQSRTPSSDLLC